MIVLCSLIVPLSSWANDHYHVLHYSVKDGLSQNTVMAITQDKQGFMWFGTWDGLNRFDGYTFTVYKAMHDGVPAQVNNRVEIIYEDEQERIWWMTYDGHFYRLDAARQVTTEQRYEDLPVEMLERIVDADRTTQIDNNDIIWQADEKKGIMRYRDGKWKRFTPTLRGRYAGRLREHFFLIEDKLGRTWVNPTGGGWSYYDYDKDELVNPLEGMTNMIHTAYIDRDGQMWIATYDGGVDCVNMDPVPYTLYDMRAQGEGSGEVRAFLRHQNGDASPLVLATTNAYCALETQHGVLIGTKGEGIKNILTSHSDIYDMEEDAAGTLYVATYGGGVNVLRWDEKKHTWSAPTIIGEGFKVRDILVTDSLLWCGTTTGLLRVDLKDYSWVVLPSYDIRAVCYSHDRIWLGSFGGGLMWLDPADPQMQIHPVQTYHDIILSMVAEGQNLWFTSESDIAQLNVETSDLYYYDVLDDKNSCFTEAEAVCTSQGIILFGYSDGYCAFDPSQISCAVPVPSMRITCVTVEDSVYTGDTVYLDHGNSVTIDYAAMDFVGADKIFYYYKMDGVDADWHAATDLRRVTYARLQHGRYIFHVRSTDREGGDVDNEKVLVLLVRRPTWLRWWAIMLYVIAILLIIGLTVYSIHVGDSLRQKMKMEKKMADLKLQFYTNIGHELRTPLTLIIAPVENILQNERVSQHVRTQLEIILGNSRSMLDMVNRMLDYSQQQEQKRKESEAKPAPVPAMQTAPTLDDRLEQLEQEPQETKRTILVVDDNEDMCRFLTGIFSKSYNVESAENGEEAKKIIMTKPVDIVVTDLMMPVMDGLELTQFIKNSMDWSHIPVILLTAKTAIESRLQAMQYGADDYVTKPFEPEYLQARVRNILTQRDHLEHSYRQRLMRLESQKTDAPIPGDAFLAKLLTVMERQLDNNTLTVEELVDEMGMGRTVFFNKLKSMTGLSPVEFIREMRIKKAAQLLEERKYNITEITYMVGMNDSRYFSKCFKSTYGVTPSEYRNQIRMKS